MRVSKKNENKNPETQPYPFALSQKRILPWCDVTLIFPPIAIKHKYIINMKRLNSPQDDNVPIYIFGLLFTVLILSFLGTYPDTSKSRLVKSTPETQ